MIAVQQFADTAAPAYGACTDALLNALDWRNSSKRSKLGCGRIMAGRRVFQSR